MDMHRRISNLMIKVNGSTEGECRLVPRCVFTHVGYRVSNASVMGTPPLVRTMQRIDVPVGLGVSLAQCPTTPLCVRAAQFLPSSRAPHIPCCPLCRRRWGGGPPSAALPPAATSVPGADVRDLWPLLPCPHVPDCGQHGGTGHGALRRGPLLLGTCRRSGMLALHVWSALRTRCRCVVSLSHSPWRYAWHGLPEIDWEG